ncbi:hypothetical protein AV530_011770 [Patagioenas fasciata monilis]|uniref:Uncharacterized protein n=1 Tax=Patagioenas fasciata monilis TaxID=372326 RepID=A0A1V4KNI1_PATFA|nr:hypothetical protein AV530_011770 [Patagioenas fasciata monilis]
MGLPGHGEKGQNWPQQPVPGRLTIPAQGMLPRDVPSPQPAICLEHGKTASPHSQLAVICTRHCCLSLHLRNESRLWFLSRKDIEKKQSVTARDYSRRCDQTKEMRRVFNLTGVHHRQREKGRRQEEPVRTMEEEAGTHPG